MEKLRSKHFGELDYAKEDIIHLPDGLIGLHDLKDWLLLDMEQDVPLKWFHSIDRPDFCVPVTEPCYFTNNYTVRVPEPYHDILGSSSQETIAVLVITTIHPGGKKVTGNLLAPLLIDIESRRGVQLPLQDENLSLHHEIDYLKFGLAVKSNAAENEDKSVSVLESERTGATHTEGQKVGV